MPNFPVKRKGCGDIFACDEAVSFEPAAKRLCQSEIFENLKTLSDVIVAEIQSDDSSNSESQFRWQKMSDKPSLKMKVCRKKVVTAPEQPVDGLRACRIVLTATLAREVRQCHFHLSFQMLICFVQIYKMRPTACSVLDNAVKSGTALSREIGQRYHVSGKTVRDIWSRVTWADATQNLWTANELHAYINSRAPGKHILLCEERKDA